MGEHQNDADQGEAMKADVSELIEFELDQYVQLPGHDEGERDVLADGMEAFTEVGSLLQDIVADDMDLQTIKEITELISAAGVLGDQGQFPGAGLSPIFSMPSRFAGPASGAKGSPP